LSRVSPVQYSPRRQSRWVLANYGGKDLWKKVSFEPGMEQSIIVVSGMIRIEFTVLVCFLLQRIYGT